MPNSPFYIGQNFMELISAYDKDIEVTVKGTPEEQQLQRIEEKLDTIISHFNINKTATKLGIVIVDKIPTKL